MINLRNDGIGDFICAVYIGEVFAASRAAPIFHTASRGAGCFYSFMVCQRVASGRDDAAIRYLFSASETVGVSGITVFRTGCSFYIPYFCIALMVIRVNCAVFFSAFAADRFGMASRRTACVYSVAELLAIIREGTSFGSACMPVVGIVAAPGRIPIMRGCNGYRLADGL